MAEVSFVITVPGYAQADAGSFISVANELARLVALQFPVANVRPAVKTIAKTNSQFVTALNTDLLNPKAADIKTITIAGAAAGSHSGVTGIVAASTIVKVLSVDDTTHAATDATAEYTLVNHLPGTGTIDNTGGTTSSGAHLVVCWY